MSRFLHLIDDLEYGGTQRQLQLLATAAVARGDKIAVGSLRRPGVVGDELRTAGVAVRWLGRRFALDPLVVGRLARAFSRGALDCVQSWDPESGRHVLAAIRLAKNAPRWFHTVRASEEPNALEPWVRRAADGIITPGPALRDRLIEQGVPADKVHVVPNGVLQHVAQHGLDDNARQRVRHALAIPDDVPVVVAVGRFDEAAYAKELAWAIDLLRAVRPGVRLLLVGDGVARCRVQRFAREATEPGTVQFLGPCTDWPDRLAAADVVWCASASPDVPTPLLEAVAAGKPCIASQAPGREALIETEWLTEWNDRAGWARATDQLMGSPELARRCAEAARARLGEKHGIRAILVAHDAAAGLKGEELPLTAPEAGR